MELPESNHHLQPSESQWISLFAGFKRPDTALNILQRLDYETFSNLQIHVDQYLFSVKNKDFKIAITKMKVQFRMHQSEPKLMPEGAARLVQSVTIPDHKRAGMSGKNGLNYVCKGHGRYFILLEDGSMFASKGEGGGELCRTPNLSHLLRQFQWTPPNFVEVLGTAESELLFHKGGQRFYTLKTQQKSTCQVFRPQPTHDGYYTTSSSHDGVEYLHGMLASSATCQDDETLIILGYKLNYNTEIVEPQISLVRPQRVSPYVHFLSFVLPLKVR